MWHQNTVNDKTQFITDSYTGSNTVFNARYYFPPCGLAKTIKLSVKRAVSLLMCLSLASCMLVEEGSISGSHPSDHLSYNSDNQSKDIHHSDSVSLPPSVNKLDLSVETNLVPVVQKTSSSQSTDQIYQVADRENPINSSELPVRIVGDQKPNETILSKSKVSDFKSGQLASQVAGEKQMAPIDPNSDQYPTGPNSTGPNSTGPNSTGPNSTGQSSIDQKPAVAGPSGALATDEVSQKLVSESGNQVKRDLANQISDRELADKVSDGNQDLTVKQLVKEAVSLQNETHAIDQNTATKIAELTEVPKGAGSSNESSAAPKVEVSWNSKNNQKLTAFYHLSQGGYKTDIQGSSEVIVMDNHENVMDFLKYVEIPNTQFNFSDWLKFDFQREQVLGFLVRNPSKGMFIQLKSLSIDESTPSGFDVSYETYQEDSSCSLTQWMSTEVGFHLVRIPRHPKLAAGSYPVRAQGSEVKGCHGLLANFSQSEAAKPLVSEVIWRGDIERPQSHIKIFQKNWEAWNHFTSNYCLECKKAESKSGFPDQQIAILVSAPGSGQLHLKKIFRSSGILFLDLERDDCKVEKNSILFLMKKKDLGLPESMLDQSKIALSGPWIPKTKTCQP